MNWIEKIKGIFPECREKIRKTKEVFCNLVFKGGGVRGIAYVGALKAMDEHGLLRRIERVAGASSGAIASLLFSFRLLVSRMHALFDTLDLSKVHQNVKKTDGLTKKILPLKSATSYRRLFEVYGWCSSEVFYQWEKNITADHCHGNALATFNDCREYGYRDLYIVVSNLSRHQAETFSAETTPEMAVAYAVRMSMSIPLFFESLRFNGHQFGDGDYYVDGGMYNNCSIHIFDQQREAHRSRSFNNNINLETLGLFLNSDKIQNNKMHEIPENLWEYIDLAVRSIYDSTKLPAWIITHWMAVVQYASATVELLHSSLRSRRVAGYTNAYINPCITR